MFSPRGSFLLSHSPRAFPSQLDKPSPGGWLFCYTSPTWKPLTDFISVACIILFLVILSSGGLRLLLLQGDAWTDNKGVMFPCSPMACKLSGTCAQTLLSPHVVSLHLTVHSLHSSWVPVQALPAQALCFSLKFLICKMAITLPVGEVYWET